MTRFAESTLLYFKPNFSEGVTEQNVDAEFRMEISCSELMREKNERGGRRKSSWVIQRSGEWKDAPLRRPGCLIIEALFMINCSFVFQM